MAAFLNQRGGRHARTVEINSTHRNHNPRFNPRAPWRLGAAAAVGALAAVGDGGGNDDGCANGDDNGNGGVVAPAGANAAGGPVAGDDEAARGFGRPFSVEGAQTAHGAVGSLSGRTIYAVALREGGLQGCGVTMLTTNKKLAFDNWHVVRAPVHRPGKDRLRRIILMNFEEYIRPALQGNGIILRTRRQDCQSWFLLRMGVCTSTVAYDFTDGYQSEQAEERQAAGNAAMAAAAAVCAPPGRRRRGRRRQPGGGCRSRGATD